MVYHKLIKTYDITNGRIYLFKNKTFYSLYLDMYDPPVLDLTYKKYFITISSIRSIHKAVWQLKHTIGSAEHTIEVHPYKGKLSERMFAATRLAYKMRTMDEVNNILFAILL